MKSSKTYPKREEFQWRPASLLCKRFDLPDPSMGKPGTAPRARNKMDSLIFLPDTVKAVSDLQEPKKETTVEEPEVEVEVKNVERPVDLYKAIFSDDSEDDDEEQPMNGKRQEGQEKKNEVAAVTTLNRLIAGDFLESLGKELGFEVPSDVTYQEGTKPVEEDHKSKRKSDAASEKRPGVKDKPGEKMSSFKLGSEEEKSTKKRDESPRNVLSSTDYSGDEGRRKRSKKDRHRNNDTERDSSSDYHNRDKRSSRSRRKRRESSSREKRSSHKKHHTKDYKTKDSSSSRYSVEKQRRRD